MEHVSRSAFPLGAGGFTFSFGQERKRPYFLVVANDLIAGSATGTPVSVSTSNSRTPFTIPYGTVRTLSLRAGTWTMSGNGAVVDFDCADEIVPLIVQIVTIAAGQSVQITGSQGVAIRQTGLGEPIIAGDNFTALHQDATGQMINAPATVLGKDATDPRQIRALAGTDKPDVTANTTLNFPTNIAADGVGLAKAAQLPASLSTGGHLETHSNAT